MDAMRSGDFLYGVSGASRSQRQDQLNLGGNNWSCPQPHSQNIDCAFTQSLLLLLFHGEKRQQLTPCWLQSVNQQPKHSNQCIFCRILLAFVSTRAHINVTVYLFYPLKTSFIFSFAYSKAEKSQPSIYGSYPKRTQLSQALSGSVMLSVTLSILASTIF